MIKTLKTKNFTTKELETPDLSRAYCVEYKYANKWQRLSLLNSTKSAAINFSKTHFSSKNKCKKRIVEIYSGKIV